MERFSKIIFVAATTARTSSTDQTDHMMVDQVSNPSLDSFLRDGWTPIEFVPCTFNTTTVGIVAVLGKL